MRRAYKLALRLCRSSNHPKYRMAAVLLKGGAIVSHGSNRARWGRHAELRCLRPGISGDTIIIAREGSRMSKPCAKCHSAILKAGITKVVYLDWNGMIQEERL